METKTETVEQRLVRELEVMTAQHAMPAAIQTALKPLVPLARLVLKASEERDEAEQKIRLQDAAEYREKIDFQKRRVEELTQAYDETKAALDKAQEDAGTLRRQLGEAHEREAEKSALIEELTKAKPPEPVVVTSGTFRGPNGEDIHRLETDCLGGCTSEAEHEAYKKRLARDFSAHQAAAAEEIPFGKDPEPTPTPDGGPVNPPAPPPPAQPILGDCTPPRARGRRKES